MEVMTAKQVRFAKIVEVGGQPEAYLPFSDPEKDKAFMRAAKDVRVVTLKQEPASKRKDFGIVGYVKENYATYLIFPKSLGAFEGQRVIGIDYDVLGSADVRIGGKVPAVPKRPANKTKLAKVPERPSPEPAKKEKPKPEPKPEPQPETFTVDVRVTAIEDKQVQVRAWNAKEARALALKETEGASDFNAERMSAKVVRLRKQ